MKISNETIRKFRPCYDPSEVGIPDNESLEVAEWIEKYRKTVKEPADIIWLICRNEFMSDRDMRLFAVWCARETYKYCDTIDPRSINAVDTSERYANGEATSNELSAAWSAARSAARSAAWSAARSAARSAAWSAARSAARSAQIDKLLTYFK